ncbi:hypothetical protein IC006_1157 [Sulfuracidifex tepidarius]|uniref:DUF5622 domain-containing protein n=2 Tax=Sulfuracidifex tepidarius TaxID=1294262 RepID=A0A510E296_9CREN|nr:DUF5622 domain-containing protein [Sulfuracidifex tepidarius]BBG23861.1 hypothetical protein IC006_1157 [Sulfuracidifex tepidarius]BBG26616.1 hypothetical protein IC007_1132 [Sulfuracidifex tepidarius]
MLKHDKIIYIEVKKGTNEKETKFYVKARSFKSKDYNSPEKYILLNSRKEKPPRNATIVKVDDLPLEVKEKLLK